MIASGSTSSPYSRSRRFELGARLGDRCLQQRLALGAEDDVFEHREILDQHEVLVDHADADGDGVVGRVDRHRLAADADLAAVGLVEAVEDRHQRRLAGAVLADDAVDGAALDFQMDVAVGMDRAKTLVDADQARLQLPPYGGPTSAFFIVWSKSVACRRSPCQRGYSRQKQAWLSISKAHARRAMPSLRGGRLVMIMPADRTDDARDPRRPNRKRRSRSFPARSPSNGR